MDFNTQNTFQRVKSVGDTISRQAAIDYCEALMNAEREQQTDDWGYGRERYNQTEVIQHYLENMPSAQPEREKGKWYIDAEGNVRCTDCKTKCLRDDIGVNILSSYCPNCGADMRGEQDE